MTWKRISEDREGERMRGSLSDLMIEGTDFYCYGMNILSLFKLIMLNDKLILLHSLIFPLKSQRSHPPCLLTQSKAPR
jgi:hypothetical protein